MEQRCFIRVVNGEAFEHPITEENLQMVVQDFDPENPPEGLEKFIRKPVPAVGFLETFVGTTYKRVDGIIQDVHEIRPLTEDEKNAKIKFMKDHFPFPSWTLDEIKGEWIPPIPHPNDGKCYVWDEEKQIWFEIV